MSSLSPARKFWLGAHLITVGWQLELESSPAPPGCISKVASLCVCHLRMVRTAEGNCASPGLPHSCAQQSWGGRTCYLVSGLLQGELSKSWAATARCEMIQVWKSHSHFCILLVKSKSSDPPGFKGAWISRPSLEISFLHALLSLGVVFRLDDNRWAPRYLSKMWKECKKTAWVFEGGPKEKELVEKINQETEEEKVGKSDAVEAKGAGSPCHHSHRSLHLIRRTLWFTCAQILRDACWQQL